MTTENDTTQTDNNSNDAAGDQQQDGNQDQTQQQGDSSQQKGEEGQASEQDQNDKGDSSQDQDGESGKDDKGEEGKKEEQAQTFDENEELGAPEEYSDLTVPDGFEMQDEQKQRVNDMARKYKLNNFQRDGMLNFHTDVLKELTEAADKQRQDTFNKWDEQTKTDPELSGMNQGTTKDEIDSVMQRGMDKLSEPAVYEADVEIDGVKFAKGDPVKDENGNAVSRIDKLARETGMIHNPEFRRVMYRAGKLIRPDTIVGGNTDPDPQEGKDPAEILFPDQGKDKK